MALEQTTTIPEIGEAIVQVRRLSADEKVQQEAWYREKQLLDEASALDSAYKRGQREGEARGVVKGELNAYIKLVKSGMLTLEQGAKVADMPVSEFEKLFESNF